MFTRRAFRVLTVFLFAAALVSNYAHADFDRGQEAFDQGDFETAYQEWSIDANEGDPDAQYNLAGQYARGEGTTQDLGEAIRLIGTAARLGHEEAATDLARITVCARLGVLEYGYAHITIGKGARGDVSPETFEDITRNCSGLVLSNAR